jgi:hypothetical protein
MSPRTRANKTQGRPTPNSQANRQATFPFLAEPGDPSGTGSPPGVLTPEGTPRRTRTPRGESLTDRAKGAPLSSGPPQERGLLQGSRNLLHTLEATSTTDPDPLPADHQPAEASPPVERSNEDPNPRKVPHSCFLELSSTQSRQQAAGCLTMALARALLPLLRGLRDGAEPGTQRAPDP